MKYFRKKEEKKGREVSGGRGTVRVREKELRVFDRLRGVRLTRAYVDAANEAAGEYRRFSREPTFVRGVSMFWMGGTKTLKNQVKFASTDPRKIAAFLGFLHDFCGVGAGEVRIVLSVYPDIDPESAQRFWSFATGIPLSGFYRVGHLPPRKKVREASQGLCTLIVHNAYLRTKLGAWADLLAKEQHRN